MERFEMDFKNPIIRIWFCTVFPTIIVAIVLLVILPLEYHNLIILLEAFVVIVFWVWCLFYKKKRTAK